jgi:hypothetical protein
MIVQGHEIKYSDSFFANRQEKKQYMKKKEEDIPMQITDAEFVLPQQYERVEAEGPIEINWREAYVEFIQDLKESSLEATAPALSSLLAGAYKSCERIGHLINDRLNCAVSKIEGGPGCAKSWKVLEEFDEKRDLYICPTRELKRQMDIKFKKKKIKATALTLHYALTSKPFQRVFIDEGFMFPAGYIACIAQLTGCKEVVLVGDSKQIGQIDFNDMYLRTTDLLREQSHNISGWYSNWNFRCPADIVSLLNRHFNYKMTTRSKVLESIKYSREEFDPGAVKKDEKVIVMTQALKATLKGVITNGSVNTSHELQGFETNIVHLVLDKASKALCDSAPHVVVALSRHKEQIFIYDPEGFLEARIIDNPAILNNDNVVPISDFEVEREPILLPRTDCYDEKPTYDHFDDHVTIDKILDRHYPSAHVEPSFACILPSDMRAMKGTINVASLNGEESTPGRMLPGKRHAKDFRARRDRQALHCAIERRPDVDPINYTDKTNKLIANRVYKNMKRKVFKMGADFYKPSWEQFSACLIEACKKMDDRETLHLVEDFDCRDKRQRNLDFFMKTIIKVKKIDEPMTSDKAGQGVIAMSKTVNSLFAAWARLASKQLKEVLQDNVLIADGLNEDEMYAHFKSHVGDHNLDTKQCMGNDISQQDASKKNWDKEMECKMLKKMGMPDALISQYRAAFRHWRARQRGKFMIEGDQTNFSGNPFTLVFNTTHALALNCFVFDWEHALWIAVTGDDGTFVVHRIWQNQANWAFARDVLKVKFKPEKQVRPVFCSKIFTEDGVFFDYVNRACKVKSKCFSKLDEIAPYQESVKDWLKLIRSDRCLEQAITANCVEYDNNITRCEMRAVIEYLNWFANAEPKKLWCACNNNPQWAITAKPANILPTYESHTHLNWV